jgi:hypothetical protein
MGTLTDNCAGSGTWSLSVSLAANTANAITVTATDAASNSTNDSMTITHDGTPPAISITSPNGGVSFTTTVVTQTLTGSCGMDTTSLNANMGTLTNNCAGSGSWSLNVNLTPNTANTIIVTAIDPYANGASDSMTITHDTIVPVITSAETMDADGNGRIDHYKITFDNAVNDSTFIPGPWAIGDYTGITLVNGGAAPETDTINDGVIYVSFTEKPFPDTGTVPDITVAAGGIQDMGGNSLAAVITTDVVELDRARPRIESVVGAATSDRVMVTFSEPVDSSGGMSCSGNVTSLNYKNNIGGGAVTIGGWQDNYACDDATVVLKTDAPVDAADIDMDAVMPVASMIFDNADNTALALDYTVRGMINSIKFRFNTTTTGANVANNVSEFPVLIRITNPAIIDATQSNASDIRFEDPIADGGAILPFEVERWDQTNNVAEVWVLVPTVSGNSDADYITMYYNDKTDGTVPGRQEPGKVFSLGAGSSFAGVWHLAEGDGAVKKDSTVNKNNSSVHTTTIFTGTPILGPSAVGPSQQFNGSTYIQFDDTAVNNGDALDGTASGGLTVSAWVKPANGNFGTLQSIIAKQASTFVNDGYQLLTQTSTENITYRAYSSYNLNDALAAGTIQTDWYYFAAYLNSSTNSGYLYFNGVDTGASVSGTPHVVANETPVTLGRQLDGTYPFTGYMDEVRVENTHRGADWIKLCYENQRPNQTLVSSWYNNAWSNRIKITVNESLVSSTGIDQFPVYVDLSRMPAAFFTSMQHTDGSDILVTADDGITRLPRELASFNKGGLTGQLYFKAPSLSLTYNTNFYIYYNSTSTEANDAANVWSYGYVGVWHMEDLSPTDSTGKHSTVSATGTVVPAQIGNGIQFNGTTDYIRLTDGGSVTWGDTVRIIAWFTPSSDASGDMPIVSKTDNSTGGFEMIVNPSLELIELWTYPYSANYAYADGTTPTTFNITAGTPGLYGMTAVGSSNYARIYYNGNGVWDVGTVDALAPIATDLYIGKYAASAGYLYGTLDEVRIQNINLGTGWQATEMNNMLNQASFVMISSPETK